MSRAGPGNFIPKLFRKDEVVEQTEYPTEEKATESTTQKGVTEGTEGVTESSGSDTESEILQHGVKQAEAVAAAWTMKALVIAYAGIFLVFFVNSLQQQITGNLTPYVTSAFQKHALLSTTSVMSSIIGAVAKLPIAKIIDIWGRSEGYMLMVFLCTLGLIMMASCNNVETYAAAQVFYWVGYNGMTYVLDVFIADTSSLKNRAWIFAFSTCPYIATTFAGPAAADSFYHNSGWRWAFGTFAIVIPVISAPVVMIFVRSRKKAESLGYLRKSSSGRTFSQSVWHYIIQFDALGLLLIIAAFSLFLLPFSLATYQPDKWQSPSIIAMIIIGGLCFIAFGIWERFFAPVCFVPFHLLVDRTVLGACLLGATSWVSFYCWDLYFLSYLQVVHDLSLKNAGFVGNIFNIGSCFWAVIVGLIIRTTGKFKYLALAAVPLQILGVGLMIHFRQPNTDIGYVIMCQIFIAFSGGTLVICQEMAVMAAASHSEVAVVLALLGLFTSAGGAVGQTVAGAIWTNTLPKYLELYLPEDSKHLAAQLYAVLDTQLKYPMGSPIRTAIIQAYAVAQRRMLICATAVLPIAFVCVLIWRDIQVKTIKQVKGTVA
ncbi:hypothetical protein FQN54_006505 [Arachnomyces sp. PD_36]|nr:hypothetical protein FQN54_006505 [Arachnomyces sp. PD_36]